MLYEVITLLVVAQLLLDFLFSRFKIGLFNQTRNKYLEIIRTSGCFEQFAVEHGCFVVILTLIIPAGQLQLVGVGQQLLRHRGKGAKVKAHAHQCNKNICGQIFHPCKNNIPCCLFMKKCLNLKHEQRVCRLLDFHLG